MNWCPNCQTVLANEQVVEGTCERCHSAVTRKHLTQWFFKITDYAEELLAGLDSLDWPEKTKLMQKNWIGKSVGGEVTFQLEKGGGIHRIHHPRRYALRLHLCRHLSGAPAPGGNHRARMRPGGKGISGLCRQGDGNRPPLHHPGKTGVFTGAYAINPVNGRKVPIWAADYVLASYGTGVVMAVPAHDERDFAFATKYSLPIERVIKAKEEGEDDSLPYTGYGVLVNSAQFDGMGVEQARAALLEMLKEQDKGGPKVNYRLRDWLISRQRYWGAPIPIIHCPHCGDVPVPEEDLPVRLPYDVDFTPDGTSPLAKNESFVNVACPKCGAPAKRDVDTMDTFVCSSWYYLRYPDNKDEKNGLGPGHHRQDAACG